MGVRNYWVVVVTAVTALTLHTLSSSVVANGGWGSPPPSAHPAEDTQVIASLLQQRATLSEDIKTLQHVVAQLEKARRISSFTGHKLMHQHPILTVTLLSSFLFDIAGCVNIVALTDRPDLEPRQRFLDARGASRCRAAATPAGCRWAARTSLYEAARCFDLRAALSPCCSARGG